MTGFQENMNQINLGNCLIKQIQTETFEDTITAVRKRLENEKKNFDANSMEYKNLEEALKSLDRQLQILK